MRFSFPALTGRASNQPIALPPTLKGKIMTEEEKKKIIKHHLDEIAKICPLRIGVFGWKEGDTIKNISFVNGDALNLAYMLANIKKSCSSAFKAIELVEFMEKIDNDKTND